MISRREILAATGAAATGALIVAGAQPAQAHGFGPQHQRQRSIRTVHTFYRALQNKDIDTFATLWTADAVYRVPVTPEGVPGATHGRDAIVAGLRGFFALFGTVRFTWRVEPMQDPARVLAFWSLDIDLVAGGKYVNRGVSIFQLRGDRIADFDEYFDTGAFLDTFGGPVS
jgi:ketosteroid isomerase-like protein